jgi:segregation and condensation protein B
MQTDDQKKIEAVLFTTGRFMTLPEIAQACELGSEGYVKEQLVALMTHYDQQGGALHVVEQDGRYKLNIRKEFGHLANKLVSSSEFDNPTTKTLAVIAHKNPALQSDIIHIRGNKAYDHISVLKESGLVTSDKTGRTRLLKLTPKFYDYFDTADDAVKQVFKDVEQNVKTVIAAKAGMTVEEVAQKEQLLNEAEQKEREMKEKMHRETFDEKHETEQTAQR